MLVLKEKKNEFLKENIPKPNDRNTNPICLIWEFFAMTRLHA